MNLLGVTRFPKAAELLSRSRGQVSLVALALLSKEASVLCHSKEGRLGNADGWLCAAFLGESAF